jgi:hypothetical protein
VVDLHGIPAARRRGGGGGEEFLQGFAQAGAGETGREERWQIRVAYGAALAGQTIPLYIVGN